RGDEEPNTVDFLRRRRTNQLGGREIPERVAVDRDLRRARIADHTVGDPVTPTGGIQQLHLTRIREPRTQTMSHTINNDPTRLQTVGATLTVLRPQRPRMTINRTRRHLRRPRLKHTRRPRTRSRL